MNQLDYQPAFTPSSFPHDQALAPVPYAGFQQNHAQQTFNGGQQGQQQQQPLYQQGQQGQQSQQSQQGVGQNGIFNASPVQSTGPFSSTPYNQSIPATAQQPSSVRHSASPPQPNSPYSQNAQQHIIYYPMAAPPLPQTPVSATQQFPPQNLSTPSTPQSPGADQREPRRIQLLFEINQELFQEISNLQAQGKGGAINPAMQAELRKANMDDSMAAEEYIMTLRRIQANLSYLAVKGNLNNVPSKNLPGPAHMTHPPHMPQLQQKYDRLKELFPGWVGMDNRVAGFTQPASNMTMNGIPSA